MRVFPTLVVGIIASVIANAFFATPAIAIGFAAVATLVAATLSFFISRYPRFFGMGDALAVSMIIFDGDGKLLVYCSGRQRKWIPPGTHVRRGEPPHEAALRSVREDTGYEAAFHPWHDALRQLDRIVTQVPQPYTVQVEHQLPWEGHTTHYDMVYIGTVSSQNPSGAGQSHAWVTLDELRTRETYPDVITLAERVRAECVRAQADSKKVVPRNG